MSKTLEFRNVELLPVVNFLAGLKLKGKASRGRSKFMKLLVKKNDEYIDDRDETRKPYFIKDKSGKLVAKNGKYQYKDPSKDKELTDELNNLGEEKAVIEFTEYSQKLQTLYLALSNYEGEFSGQEAVLYDLVMDQLEINFEKEGK
ncbi:DUF1617 family protein [Liquorilactobacillus uvarum]|uniref:DUF1617 family protein n=1 Tax=Liquorilactobacillus uvarum TaxID=303240 RepID=UPI00288B7B4B|nr:DUF1617 family protein [Liquorilactobacillus uvarum]